MLIRGSSLLATSYGVKKVIIGLTLVAFGTSTPELVVSVLSALKGAEGISVGNVVGSNIANSLLILGIATVLRPVKVNRQLVSTDVPVMIFFTILLVIFAYDGSFQHWEGWMLLFCFAGYLILAYWKRKETGEMLLDLPDGIDRWDLLKKRGKNYALCIFGLIALYLGGEGTVRGAVSLAHYFGISNVVIGLSVVAVGTSLPELFTSIVAIVKHEHDISLGNIVGSNIFNIALVLGTVVMIHPFNVPFRVTRFDLPTLFIVSILLAGTFYWKRKIPRWIGFIFIALYVIYMGMLYNV